MKQLLLVVALAGLCGWLIAVRVGKSADARAYATVRMADQRAANMAQARKQEAVQFELEMRKKEATAPHVVNMRIIVAYAVAALAVVVSVAIGYFSLGVARAGVVAAQIRGRLIPMDPETMHFRGYLYDNGRRQYAVDLNTGLVIPVDETRTPTRAMIEGSFRTRQFGAQPKETILLNKEAT